MEDYNKKVENKIKKLKKEKNIGKNYFIYSKIKN